MLADKTKRLFFAVCPSNEIVKKLVPILSSLPAGWKAVSKDQLHLTLAFMAEVPEGDLTYVINVGKEVVSNISPFDIQITKTDCFPNKNSPKVLFFSVVAPQLEVIAESLKKKLLKWVDTKPFVPHLTLARAKSSIAKYIEYNLSDAKWLSTDIKLFESKLTPKGAQYTILHTFVYSS